MEIGAQGGGLSKHLVKDVEHTASSHRNLRVVPAL